MSEMLYYCDHCGHADHEYDKGMFRGAEQLECVECGASQLYPADYADELPDEPGDYEGSLTENVDRY